jgi:hypothetical protein
MVHVEFFGSMALYHHHPTANSTEMSRHQAGILWAKECPTCKREREQKRERERRQEQTSSGTETPP